MARVSTVMSSSFVLGSLVAFVAIACGSSDDSTFNDPNGSSGGGGASSGGIIGGSSGSSGSSGASGGPCVGLECQQVACPGGGTTSLSGTVYDPAGTVPLYNAIVYVPNAPLEPFKDGVTCDQCGTAPSGKPIATAITDAKGQFKLTNVPAGVAFPLVVQIGRWRRQVQIPATTQCTDTPLAAEMTRLPRNQTEGSIPKIAITTGGADSLECFLRKLGIDDAEFTNPDGAGRIHLYHGVGGSKAGATPDSATLWDDLDKLKNYDMTILSCEGDEYNNGSGGVSVKNATARANLSSYLDAGGRVFASHFHYTWFKNGAGALPSTASWVSNGNVGDKDMSVNATFAKGQAFKDWLVEAKASTTPGIVPGTELRRNVTSVPGSGAAPDTSRAWLSVGSDTKFYSFNAPVGLDVSKQCGRGVYTDIHVSSGGGANDSSGGTFPGNCKSPKPELSPQEKALLFLLMDLSSCIQDDGKPPTAPPPVVN